MDVGAWDKNKNILVAEGISQSSPIWSLKKPTQGRIFVKNNKRTVSNNRTGWNIFQKLISAQYLIRSHRPDFFLKINKQTCVFIRYSKVHPYILTVGTFFLPSSAI